MKQLMRRRTVVFVAVATGCVGVTGPASSVVATAGGAGRPATRVHVVAAAPPPRLETPSVVNGVQPWQRPLRLVTTGGTITAVTVTGTDGAPVAGTGSAGSWVSTSQLVPSTAYRVAVTAHAPGATRPTELRALVRTSPASQLLHALLSPGDGVVVGVGEPVVVTFNRAVPLDARTAVARRLVVSTSPAQDGGWFWVSPTELHWRPNVYWQPATRIVAALDLNGVYLGGGVWGAPGTHSIRYQIGAGHVSVVNAATHEMTVYADGHVVRVLPVSTGRDKYPTHSGVHITLDKQPVVTMDSATVGIPRNSPDGYYEKVYWDVRISDSGEFVHAAPWSVASQGSTNVSHGCVNVSPANAEWFYHFSLLGDVVNVVGTPSSPVNWDPGTADWNRPSSALSH